MENNIVLYVDVETFIALFHFVNTLSIMKNSSISILHWILEHFLHSTALNVFNVESVFSGSLQEIESSYDIR